VLLTLSVALALAAPGPAAAAQAPAAPPQKVPILLFHRVARRPFARQVAALERAGYRAVTLERAWRSWHGGPRLPRRPVVLSFDDGYASHARVALPVLRSRGWPGTLYLTLARLEHPDGLTRAQVRRMVGAGWELGAHTTTHPDLTRLDAERLREELAGPREAIRAEFGVPADHFAYPYGRSDATVAAAVRATGYTTATTIRRGLASVGDDPFALDRVSVGERTPASTLLLRIRDATRRDR
jgi:peptidoglycan/xylan/chitin deacetylase (PgdA/CDA1 family)